MKYNRHRLLLLILLNSAALVFGWWNAWPLVLLLVNGMVFLYWWFETLLIFIRQRRLNRVMRELLHDISGAVPLKALDEAVEHPSISLPIVFSLLYP